MTYSQYRELFSNVFFERDRIYISNDVEALCSICIEQLHSVIDFTDKRRQGRPVLWAITNCLPHDLQQMEFLFLLLLMALKGTLVILFLNVCLEIQFS